MANFTVYTDGGARGNPGPAAYGVCIKDENDGIVDQFGQVIGIDTNNVAEYSGVIAGLDWFLNKELVDQSLSITFLMDSLLVCSQLNGKYKIKNPKLRELAQVVMQKQKLLKEQGAMITYSHIPRSKNRCADAMVNKALDE